MKKLIVYIASSLDGFIAAPNDDLSFLNLVEKSGEDYGYNEFINSIDTIVLGKRTYDWVKSQVGTEHYDKSDKDIYVITHSNLTKSCKTTFYNKDLKELIQNLKSAEGKNIFCDGGAELVNQLIRYDLVDEYIISVIPVLLGDGIKLFKDMRPKQNLKLIKSKSYDSGLVQLHYKRVFNEIQH